MIEVILNKFTSLEIKFAFVIGSLINQTFSEDSDQCKTKERDCYCQTGANFEGKNTVENTFSLVMARESHLQVPELTREQTDDMPAFGILAYQAVYENLLVR